LLWLARVDDRGMEVATGTTVDVREMARTCTDRFQALAVTQGVNLSFDASEDGLLLLRAEPDWIDRLIGVLIDNACKYAGDGGRAAVRIGTAGNRIVLEVDDSGPGIPVDQRELIMDRFHRADEDHLGTGLGLAIADSVVRATSGTWLITESPEGGARMQVSWRKTSSRRTSDPPKQEESDMPEGVTRPDPVRASRVTKV
jgi:signal transduction histidine kinase